LPAIRGLWELMRELFWKMVTEIEIKAWVKNVGELKERLGKLGQFIKTEKKHDIYFVKSPFDPVEFDYEKDDGFRIRETDERIMVTMKKKVRKGNMEINQEKEYEIDDAGLFEKILEQSGYEKLIEKNKLSDVYRVGRFNVEVNEVDNLGKFVEMEFLTNEEEEIEPVMDEMLKLLDELGIPRDNIEPRYYIEMLNEKMKK